MKSLITEPLGLYGWKNLEAVILAALCTAKPMLLIGKHGAAKSFILERISEALKLSYRFYNASLINYDDLVGIPIPSKDKKSLEYISNPTSIWDAEVVFIDEINRTKPELQNKLFPIIYEKRVQGQDLKKLKYRFAAMNPSYIDDDEDEDEYCGAMPLDKALIDRFPFIIDVPIWDDISKKDKKKMLIDSFNGRHEFNIDIEKLIIETRKNYEICKKTYMDVSTQYIINLMNILENAFGYISSRRASNMIETLLAIHAARMTLNKYNEEDENIDLKDTKDIHIMSATPCIAYKKISSIKLLAMANEAWAYIDTDSINKKLLDIRDNRKKIIYVLKNKNELDVDTISKVILNALRDFDEKTKRALSLISYLKLKDIKNLPASMIETLSNEISPCFEIKHQKEKVYPRVNEIAKKIIGLTEKSKDKFYSNLLNSFLPDGYNDVEEVNELSQVYLSTLKEVENE